MRGILAFLVAAGGLWLARGAAAQPPAPPAAPVSPPGAGTPDLDFLEYLGSWQDDDDEWLAIREWEKDNPPADDDELEPPQRDRGRPPRSRDDDEDEDKK